MNSKTPAPRMPAAQMALYGNPKRDTERKFKEAFKQLSPAGLDRAIKFLELLVIGDMAGTEAMKRETETELAYLHHRNTREELEADLLDGRTPKGLQEAIRAKLAEQDSTGGES